MQALSNDITVTAGMIFLQRQLCEPSAAIRKKTLFFAEQVESTLMG
jgi:hypothetical protein